MPSYKPADTHTTTAIQRLISAYTDAVRRLDGRAAGRLFAPDGSVKIADYPELQGREAVTDGICKTFSKFSFINQDCDTGLIDVDGERARGRLGIFEANKRPEREGVQILFGTYEDEYVKLNEGWRFYRRYFSVRTLFTVPTLSFEAFPHPPTRFDFDL